MEVQSKSAKEKLLEVLAKHEQELKKIYPSLVAEINFETAEVLDGLEIKEIPLIKLNRFRGYDFEFCWEIATPDGFFSVRETSYKELNSLFGMEIPLGKQHEKLLDWTAHQPVGDKELPRLMRMLVDGQSWEESK